MTTLLDRERIAFEVNRRRMTRGLEPLQMARIMRAARLVLGSARLVYPAHGGKRSRGRARVAA